MSTHIDSEISDRIRTLRRELVAVSKDIYERKLSSGICGNLSARVPDCKNLMLIKASGKSFKDMAEHDFLLADMEQNLYEGEGKPSIEIKFHAGIYKARPEVNAVIHGHASYTTAVGTIMKSLKVITVDAEVGLKQIGIVDYAEAGSAELAEGVINVFKMEEINAALLRRHGFITVGKDMRQAYYLADTLEEYAKTAYLMEMLSPGYTSK
ncbi:L-fuculose-phosphate aldolase [Syntrophobotulus glycolicus DSM 8271]|uniref:L-fuculose-phosphate aldolase n=1 Tax=Syntrophobotulus glycolicus (strain DSM 8271 / FlGlyR) TaxID=645991 RepID=F0SWU3_SYNGF|nr:class II aldolase/adducin family protein [Syntrophobotulus glycolicus]ADY54633.1 L-fuculose-phosphate aldolase [Syntrophobotulus glycolicus DSM 8271]